MTKPDPKTRPRCGHCTHARYGTGGRNDLSASTLIECALHIRQKRQSVRAIACKNFELSRDMKDLHNLRQQHPPVYTIDKGTQYPPFGAGRENLAAKCKEYVEVKKEEVK